MSFPGPLSISPLQAPQNPDLGLRPFQRVTAQVLSVTGTTAVLSIEGFPIVAQLTSADQAASLLSQRSAQFIITQLSAEGMTLKLVTNNPPQASGAETAANGPEVAVRLLEQNNLPGTAKNLSLARAALNQHLPLTPGLFNELLGALAGYGTWGAAEAELAAALKAAGLPVTAESLAIASRQVAQTGEALGQLIVSLQNAGQGLPPELLKQINENLELLKTLVLQGDASPAQLAEQLRAALKLLGQTPENALLQAQGSGELSPEKSLISLILLQHTLEQAGKKDLAQTIERFLGDLHQEQFLNIKPDPATGRETWAKIGLLLQNPQAEEKFASARLRIAREPGSRAEQTPPALTRLTLQVDLESGETVEVALSLAGKQIRTALTAPDPLWCEQAQAALPDLEAALQALGFDLKEAQIEVGTPQPFSGINLAPGSPTLMTIDLEA
jgi:hypothetical protein